CFQGEDGIRDWSVTGVRPCALPILGLRRPRRARDDGAGVPHRLPRRRREPGDVREDGLRHPLPDEAGGLLFLVAADLADEYDDRSEEHTSELQSLTNLVCRLLLEKQ